MNTGINGYFEKCFLERMNKDGRTIQERVKTRKEKEFDRLELPKSKYLSCAFQLNGEPIEIPCSIQPAKWKQEKILSNILCSTSAQKFKTGDIIRTYQKVKDKELDQLYIIMMVSEDLSHGHQKYEAILLDSFINNTDDYGDTIRIIPAKFVSETSVYVQDKFTSYGAISYREPLAHRKFITKDEDFLQKNLYFDYKDRGWEIVGKDNISIDGVALVSIAEYLTSAPEPKTSQDILVGEDTNFFLNALDKRKGVD